MNKKRKYLTRVLAVMLLTLTCILCAVPALAATYPKPKNNVADEAGILSESTINSLKKANETLLSETNTQIAICTVATTGDVDIADYARGVFTEWKLGEGVLLLIASDDKNYYFVPSEGVEKILTDEVLTEIRDTYLEEYFEEGNIDRGVNMCVTKLSNTLTKGITDAADADEEDSAKDEEKGTTAGGVIVGIFKAILYIVIAIVVIFVGFFIFAMFNDEAAAILQKYIFRKKQPYRMPEEYYDERLYGRPGTSANRRPNQQNRLPQNRPQNRLPSGQQRRPQNQQSNYNGQQYRNRYNAPQNQRQGYNNGYRNQNQPRQGYSQPQNQQNQQSQPARRNTYYNADGTVRQQSRPQQTGQNYNSGNETRAFTIPNRK